jgi:hypothetical protein
MSVAAGISRPLSSHAARKAIPGHCVFVGAQVLRRLPALPR